MVSRLRDLVVLPSKNNPKFADELTAIFPLADKKVKAIGAEKNDRARFELAKKEALKLYKAKEDEIETENLRRVEREVYMVVLDNLWMQHLENMQHLREGIHWRSVGQRDPLVEYRSESQKLFEGLQRNLEEEVLRAVYNVHKHDAVVEQAQDDEYDTELTRLSENAVEKGVTTVGRGEKNRDDEFTAKKEKTTQEVNHAKNVAKKKKKAQRQNRKKGRK
jgi:preprotein translocase subunit SecA